MSPNTLKSKCIVYKCYNTKKVLLYYSLLLLHASYATFTEYIVCFAGLQLFCMKINFCIKILYFLAHICQFGNLQINSSLLFLSIYIMAYQIIHIMETLSPFIKIPVSFTIGRQAFVLKMCFCNRLKIYSFIYCLLLGFLYM